MGGRSKDRKAPRKEDDDDDDNRGEYDIPERFLWIKELSDERLEGYIRVSEVRDSQGGDPQKRAIETVGYYARFEQAYRSRRKI